MRDVLVEVRYLAGLSQRALARQLNRPQSFVSKIESGERGIDPLECIAWAKACGMPPLEFFARLLTRLDRRVWK